MEKYLWIGLGGFLGANARYLVLASGTDPDGKHPYGFDFARTRLVEGVPELMAVILEEEWPVVATTGREVRLKTFEPGGRWPVAVGGEYLVLANPRFVK